MKHTYIIVESSLSNKNSKDNGKMSNKRKVEVDGGIVLTESSNELDVEAWLLSNLNKNEFKIVSAHNCYDDRL
jgi:hypothetical protein